MILRTLVSTELLAARLGAPDWVPLDCRFDLTEPARGRQEYARAHIPGARYLHLDEDLSAPKTGANGRHPLPERERFAEILRRAGVDAGSQVVAYDAQGGMVAARLWWMMRWLGHEAVAVLDGGWQKWLAEGRPQSSDVPRPAASRLPVREGAHTVDAQHLLARLGSDEVVLLDARAPDRYCGRNETLDPVGGRIPGARNRHYRDNLAADGCFKPAQALRAEFAAATACAPADKVVHYCGSGVSACHNLLAMEAAGLRGSTLYPGSWSEWCADRSRPVATGEPAAGKAPGAARPH